MSIQEWEDLGKQLGLTIQHIPSTLHKRIFFISYLGEVTLAESNTMEDVITMIYNKGIKDGTTLGKREKVQEIQRALDLS
jgi:hypothetical protein